MKQNELKKIHSVSNAIMRPPDGLLKDKFYLFFCGALQNAAFARHWDWGRREFTLV